MFGITISVYSGVIIVLVCFNEIKWALVTSSKILRVLGGSGEVQWVFVRFSGF